MARSLLDQQVLAHHAWVLRAPADLEMRAPATDEETMLPPAHRAALPHRQARVADLGVRAEHLGAVGIEVRRGDHVARRARELALDLDERATRGKLHAADVPGRAVEDDVTELPEAVGLAAVAVRHEDHRRQPEAATLEAHTEDLEHRVAVFELRAATPRPAVGVLLAP